jgi:hypothetical protein
LFPRIQQAGERLSAWKKFADWPDEDSKPMSGLSTKPWRWRRFNLITIGFKQDWL